MVRLALFSLLTLSLSLSYGQTPVDVGREGAQTTAIEANTGADLWATQFDEENVGFLHVYVDPNPDPLETYLFKGQELTQAAIDMMPARLKKLANRDNTKVYATVAVKGIGENLYLTRIDGPRRDQIDMFAIRDGRIKHLKTLAYRDCGGSECLQMDSYITDVNLDTDFDLIQIARRTTESQGTTDERRTVYYMPSDTKRWKRTEELDVPWEGITFFEPSEDEN
jgi:hypothetical protein